MGLKLEVFSSTEGVEFRHGTRKVRSAARRNLIEITVIFSLIILAVWTPNRHAQFILSMAATACVLVLAVTGRWTMREMGLTRPFSGAAQILIFGGLACGAIALGGIALRSFGPGYGVPPTRSWQYAIWALEQEFILQAIFFIRLEDVVAPRLAVIGAAGLFAMAHIPSPVLTALSFCGGVLFCELFRRWRNLYPLGLIHAALGLTIAASFPDRWMHHMRVGIGYIVYR